MAGEAQTGTSTKPPEPKTVGEWAKARGLDVPSARFETDQARYERRAKFVRLALEGYAAQDRMRREELQAQVAPEDGEKGTDDEGEKAEKQGKGEKHKEQKNRQAQAEYVDKAEAVKAKLKQLIEEYAVALNKKGALNKWSKADLLTEYESWADFRRQLEIEENLVPVDDEQKVALSAEYEFVFNMVAKLENQLILQAQSDEEKEKRQKEIDEIDNRISERHRVANIHPELAQYAREFDQQVKDKPLSQWTTDELKRAYKDWQIFTASLTKRLEKDGVSFGELEQITADSDILAGELVTALGNRIREEMEAKLRNTTPPEDLASRVEEQTKEELLGLFGEAATEAARQGAPFRRIGAASSPLTIPGGLTLTSPTLLRIEREFNNLQSDPSTNRLMLRESDLVDIRREIREALNAGGLTTDDSAAGQDFIDQINRMIGVEREAEDLEQQRQFQARQEDAIQREKRGIYGERKLLEWEKEALKVTEDTDEILLLDDYGDPLVDASGNPTGEKVTAREFRDRIFNRIMFRADLIPDHDFRQAMGTDGEIEFREFMRVFSDSVNELQTKKSPTLADKDNILRLKEIIRHYSMLESLREVLHNANYIIITHGGSEDFVKYLSSFRDEHFQLAYSIPGVVAGAHFHGLALRQVKDENGGFIPADEVAIDPSSKVVTAVNPRAGRVERLAKEYLRKANETDRIKVWDPAQKKYILRKLTEQEIDRAYSMGRGMRLVTLEEIEVAASSRLPFTTASGIQSLYCQKILNEIMPFRHILQKFNAGEVKLAVVAQLVNRDPNKPWSYEELQEFTKAMSDFAFNVMDGLAGFRYINVPNPLLYAGLFSITHSGWRWESATVRIRANKEGEKRVGASLRIEELRGAIKKNKNIAAGNTQPGDKIPTAEERRQAEASALEKEKELRELLQRMAEIQPLKLYQKLDDLADTPLGIEARKVHDRLLFKILEDAGVTITYTGENRAQEPKNGKYPSGTYTLTAEDFIKVKLRGPDRNKKDFEWFVKHQVAIRDELEKLGLYDDLAFLQEDFNSRIIEDPPDPSRPGEKKGSPSKFDDPTQQLDTTIITDPARRARAERFIQMMQAAIKAGNQPGGYGLEEIYIKHIVDTPNDEWGYIWGTEDVPYAEYYFPDGGPNFMPRRLGELNAAAAAGKKVQDIIGKMDSYNKPEDIREDLQEIFNNIKIYNEEHARTFIQNFSEGIIKFYSKDWYSRMPLGWGTAHTLGSGAASFAQFAFGRHAMAWDESDVYNMLHITLRGMMKEEQIHELETRVISGKINVAIDWSRVAIPLMALAMAYYVYKNVRGQGHK